MVLLTRSADLRQARHTSIIENIVLWTDRDGANPALDLRNLLNDLDLLGARIGVEYDTHGLTAFNGRRLDEQLQTFGQIADASGIVGAAAPVQEPGRDREGREGGRTCRRRARRGAAADQAGRRRGAPSWPPCRARSLPAAATIRPTNSSSAPAPTRCSAATRPAAASSTKNDQLTLEWAGVFHHYHAADDAHGADRQGLEAPSGAVRRRPRRAAGGREGDDARQHVRRRLRRPCPHAWKRTA